jgi:3-oxoacyl-[acyl-carrier protein] reductase
LKALADRAAVVTGGSRGIGRAIVERLVGEGARVYFTYATRAAEANALLASLTDKGAVAFTGQLDISATAQIREVFADADALLGGIDIVVHSACTTIRRNRIAEITDAEYDFMVDGNLKGGFVVLREAARRIRDGGRIITISSLDTANPAAANGLYAASKAAVEQLTAIASKELGERGVTANTVSPGAVDTSRLRDDRTAEELAGAVAVTPLGRLGHPDDIAAVVAFLAGPDGGWITGQNIRAGGGIV